MKKILLHIALMMSLLATAGQYQGRVVDEQGHPIGYATVYPKADPVQGTATNMDGVFTLETTLPDWEDVIISFIGYEKVVHPLALFSREDGGEIYTITLKEQPIALEETVVAAKASKQKNKRKQMAYLLSQVFNQMEQDFSNKPARYQIVSDVRMDSEGEAWGMEQMIATIVNLPEQGQGGRDSVQFHGDYCKRYFRQDLREKADTILAGNSLETFDKSKKPMMNYRQAANSVDSGVVVHRSLWAMGNIRYDFQTTTDEIRKWTVSNESEGETVLTHTDKHNYLGIFKMEFVRNYILDSQTLSVRRFSERAEFWVNIPFGIKLNASQLELLNLLNMGETDIEKFRLRKAHARITLNTIYQRQNGHIYILEKNLNTDALIQGTKDKEIPIQVKATQRVTRLQTENIKPMQKKELTRRLKREIVEIY